MTPFVTCRPHQLSPLGFQAGNVGLGLPFGSLLTAEAAKGLFQGYYFYHFLGRDRDAREQFRGHPHFQACVDFCERWDQRAFDPDYDTRPLEAFEPAVRRVFARTPPFAD